MWNHLIQNPLCFRKKTAQVIFSMTQDQLRHITNIQTSKSCINNQAPWQATHSLSKLTNKFQNSKHESYQLVQQIEITKSNNILLSKMMELSNKKKINRITNISTMVSFPKRNKKIIISQENQSLLKRIQSANTLYPLKLFLKDNQKNKEYKNNISRRKMTHEDFTILAKKEQLRKALTSSSSQRNFRITEQLFNNKYNSNKSEVVIN